MAERCSYSKPDGSPCRSWPKRGERRCASHLGLAHRRPLLGTDAGEELQAKVVAFLRNGNYVSTACQANGLGISTFYAWTERGEADIEAGVASVYSEFVEACTRAKAEGRAVLLNTIRKAGVGDERKAGDWKAAAWILERTNPDEFGPRREVRHATVDSLPPRNEPPELPEDEDRLVTVVSLMAEIGVVPDP